MNRHLKGFGVPISRRQFMIGAAGLSFAIALDGPNVATMLAKQQTGETLSPWISIGEDLDADWTKVKIVPAPPIEAIYGNPGFGRRIMYTSSTNAVSSYYQP